MTSFVLLILALIEIVNATLGVDLSASFTNFQCFKQLGYSFAIVRGYRSYGAVDMDGFNNMKNSLAAGLITDVYFFPCKGKVSVDQQVNDFLSVYSQTNQDYGMVWIDVEINPSSGCEWSTTDYTSNCDFMNSLVGAFKAKNKTLGIYASKYQWTTIFGSATACANFNTLPLWYAHYDKDPSFSDYPNYSFGAWTKPAMKQYQGTTTVCGVGVDLTYYP